MLGFVKKIYFRLCPMAEAVAGMENLTHDLIKRNEKPKPKESKPDIKPPSQKPEYRHITGFAASLLPQEEKAFEQMMKNGVQNKATLLEREREQWCIEKMKREEKDRVAKIRHYCKHLVPDHVVNAWIEQDLTFESVGDLTKAYVKLERLELERAKQLLEKEKLEEQSMEERKEKIAILIGRIRMDEYAYGYESAIGNHYTADTHKSLAEHYTRELCELLGVRRAEPLGPLFETNDKPES